MTRPHADSLFHFTGSPDAIYGILRDGFQLRYCLEQLSDWYKTNVDAIAIPMVCFCDLPISRLAQHVQRYGRYGIGMSREWGIHVGLNPVLYVTDRTQIPGALNGIGECLARTTDHAERSAAFRSVRAISSLVKPISGKMERRGKIEHVEFYDESEWRGLMSDPLHRDFLDEKEFRDRSRLELANLSIKDDCALQFFPTDVNYIFVPSDDELPRMVSLIDQLAKEKGFSREQRSLLYARLTTMEQLIRDA